MKRPPPIATRPCTLFPETTLFRSQVRRDCDKKSLAEIEKALGELAVKGRDGKISLDEMTGGTFTITNGGVFGSMMSTPILNMPQAAILGLHKIGRAHV